ncbi:MAG: MBL fold metallo-hydrolase [Pseudomonadota bacterium]
MRIDYLSSDILLFRGDSLAALATAFIDGDRVLLVDALASEYDAIDMRDYLESCKGKRVERIVLTHADGAHSAGIKLFPGADVLDLPAQPHTLHWGRHTLALFPVGGALAVDVPTADLLLTAGAVAGNVAVLGAAWPQQAADAAKRLQQRGRTRIVPRNGGAESAVALVHAQAYLLGLQTEVEKVRNTLAPEDAAGAIAAIGLDALLPGKVQATPLERYWHRDNLRRVNERQLFPATLQRAPQPAGLARKCRDTVMSVLTGMMRGLAERGV